MQPLSLTDVYWTNLASFGPRLFYVQAPSPCCLDCKNKAAEQNSWTKRGPRPQHIWLEEEKNNLPAWHWPWRINSTLDVSATPIVPIVPAMSVPIWKVLWMEKIGWDAIQYPKIKSIREGLFLPGCLCLPLSRHGCLSFRKRQVNYYSIVAKSTDKCIDIWVLLDIAGVTGPSCHPESGCGLCGQSLGSGLGVQNPTVHSDHPMLFSSSASHLFCTFETKTG